MLQDICKNLNILFDKKLNDDAILNILHAKLCNIFAFKNVTFQSSENLKNAYPLAYYAFNFVPSGGVKNLLISEINNTLLGFFDDYIEEFNKKRLNELENKHILELRDVENDNKKYKAKLASQELEIKRFRNFYNENTSSTQANIYMLLEIIKESGQGSLFIKNTEFANFFEDATLGKDKMKKEYLDMLYDFYDGIFDATGTVLTDRRNMTGIPVSCALLSDYKLILNNEKISDAFKSYLARGMARRSFIYFKKNEKYVINDKLSSVEEREGAYDKLEHYSKQIENIFNNIQLNKNYHFTQDANKYILRYKMNTNRRIADFYKLNDVLDANTEILKLNLEHSTWKIIKLAVVYHILTDCTSSLIKPESFIAAEKFFEKTHSYLEEMLESNYVSDYEKLYSYLIKNINKFKSKTDIRNQNFGISKNQFRTWFDDAVAAIAEMCESKKLGIATRVVGKRNQGFEIALFEPEKYQFLAEFDGKIQKGELIRISTSDLEVSEL